MFLCTKQQEFIHICSLNNKSCCDLKTYTNICSNLPKEYNYTIISDTYFEEKTKMTRRYIGIIDGEKFYLILGTSLSKFKMVNGLATIRVYDGKTVRTTLNNFFTGDYENIPEDSRKMLSIKLLNKFPELEERFDSYFI